MSDKRFRLAVLLSGAGSTMVNLAQRIDAGEVPAEISVVISSRDGVLGLERARERGFETVVLRRKPFKRDGRFDATAYSEALAGILDERGADLVVMAGFMTRLAAPVLRYYRVLNVHPALLPMFGGEGFYGHHVHRAVLEQGVKITGATVHLADEEYDRGPIVMQEAVPVLDDDDEDTLAARVQAAERRIYPLAVAAFAEGRVIVEGRKARILTEEV